MRVLFTSFAHDTHFFSMVPLAWALRAAGHEVRVASQPALTGTILGAGLTAVPVGDDHLLMEHWNQPWQADENIDFNDFYAEDCPYEDLLGMFTRLVPGFFAMANNDSMVDALVDFARSWRPDLVVWEPLTWAGAVAARASGAAHARLLWGPDVLGRARETFLRRLAEQPAAHRDDPLGEWLTWTLDRFGQPFVEEATCGQWTIDQEPAGIRLRTGLRTVPVRYVPYNGPSVVPDWLRAPPSDRPLVCVTLGVSDRNGLGRSTVSTAELVEAAADLDVDVVATLNAGQREQLGTPPPNVRLVDFVPLHALLPRCAAIVHHGGAGTWSTALLNGVPQVLLPETWDSVLKADRLAALGAGRRLPVDGLTADGVREALTAALGAPCRAAAGRLRAEMLAEPAPSSVAPVLERLAGRTLAKVA